MAKKNVKRLGRKILSLLLTLTMVTSLLQISAFAARGDRDDHEDRRPQQTEENTWSYAYYLGQEYLGNAAGAPVKPDPVGYGFQGEITEITFVDDNGTEWTFVWSAVDNGEWRITGSAPESVAKAWPQVTNGKEYTTVDGEYRFTLTADGSAASWTHISGTHANWFKYIRFIREYTVNVFYQNETGEVVHEEVNYTAEDPLVRDFEFKYPNDGTIADSEFEDGDYVSPITLMPADYLSDEMKAQGYEIHAATDADGNDVMNSGVTISLFGDNVLNVYCTLKAPETDTYKVVHEYYTNEELDNKVNDELTIEQGTEINAELIEGLKQPVNNEITYEFTSYDVDPATKTITLVYKRTYIPPAPILGIEKSADKSSGMAGDVINYTITVSNTGNASATNVVVTDAPDANLVVDAENLSGGVYDAEAGTISWTIAEIAAGASWSVTIPMTLTASEGDTEAVNTASIEDGDGDDETVSFLGSLEIIKEASGVAVPGDAEFTITCEGFSKTVSYSEFVDGKYLLENLPLGIYTVSEDEESAKVEGFDLTVSGNDAEAEVGAAETAQVTITNTYEKIVPPTGSLTIEKKVSEGMSVPSDAIFTLKQGDEVIDSVTYYDFTNGKYTFTDLPVGKYTVVESNADIDNYTLNAEGNGTEVEVVKNGTASVVIDNQYTKIIPNLGNLVINKTASGLDEGVAVSGNALFTISNGTYTDSVTYAEFNNGTYTFANIPVGEYTITETNGGVDGYSWTAPAEVKKTVVKADTVTVEIENVYTKQVGSLTITKHINGLESGIEMPEDTQFQLLLGNTVVETITWADFDKTTNSYTFSDLAVGSYSINEIGGAVDGYSGPALHKIYNGDGGNAFAVVTDGGEATAVITNTYSKTYIPQPALSVVKEADVQTAKVGDVITYTITVTNTGDATASGITIVDTPDRGLNIGEISNDGELADGQITWSVATLPAGISWSATVKAVVKNTGALSVVNTATAIDEDGNSDGDEAEVVLEATLKIKKNIVGLDAQSQGALEKVLSFTVTDPNGESTEYSYAEFKRGELKIEDPIPGVYTVVENNAEVAGYILDNGNGSWEVEVSEGGSAEILNITNKYTGKIYNIWFDGGNHGDVRNELGNEVSGVWRNLWTEIHAEESYFDWSGFSLKEGWKVYQKGIDDTDNLYDDLAENHQIPEGTSVVLYHFTWAQWLDYKNELSASKPGLSIEDGWKSDKEFYLDGGSEAFSSFEAAVEYMNANPEATIDANGFYNAYYVAVYENDPVDPPYVPPYIPSGGDDDPDPVVPPVIIEEPEVPLAELPEEEPLVELPEEEVPLADVPKTGDALFLQMILTSTSGLGLIALALSGKKREEEVD